MKYKFLYFGRATLGLIFVAANALCQCEGSLDRPLDTVHVLKSELKDMLITQKPNNEEMFHIETEFKIIPGESVGALKLKSNLTEVSSFFSLSASANTEKRFPLILPLKYEPERIMKVSKTEGHKLFFSKQNKLKEIFVSSSKYRTEKNVGVGSSVALIRQLYQTKTEKNLKNVYDVSEGITFISDGEVVTEIAVFEK